MKLKYVGNGDHKMLDSLNKNNNTKSYVEGEPQPTKKYTQTELKRMNLIGIYKVERGML